MKQIILMTILGALACGHTVEDSWHWKDGATFDVNGLLRIVDGQIQKVDDEGSWICANDEVRKICQADDDNVTWGRDVASIGTIGITTMDITDVCYSDSIIRRLAESGRVCEVMGHQWRNFDPLVIGISGVEFTGPDEVCSLCNRKRVKVWTWKETEE